MTRGSRGADRGGAFRREELRDMAWVAAGVAASTFVSLVLLSLMRLPV
jgi:hypothetical protein